MLELLELDELIELDELVDLDELDEPELEELTLLDDDPDPLELELDDLLPDALWEEEDDDGCEPVSATRKSSPISPSNSIFGFSYEIFPLPLPPTPAASGA